MKDKPTVWYIAAGYKLPAGIEAYLLHYATEIRNHGFEPRIIVFEPLPKVPHRFLVALRERGIPIESLYERIASPAHLLTLLTFLPWAGRRVICYGLKVIGGGGGSVKSYGLKVIRNTNNEQQITNNPADGSPNNEQPITNNSAEGSPNNEQQITNNCGADAPNNYSSLLTYWRKRLAVRELKRMIERERPDVIHVKGRLVTEAWPVFPSEQTIYQHALSGTVDPSWEPNEVAAFSGFLNRVARVLVQGKNIATTFAYCYHINRPIDVVFTMAPDEFAPEAQTHPEVIGGGGEKRVIGYELSVIGGGGGRGKVKSYGLSVIGGEGEGERERVKSYGLSVIGGGEQLLVNGYSLSVGGSKEEGISSPLPITINKELITKGAVAPLRFGILCRFTEQKGISYILEALKLFRERHGAVDFTFAGQGPMEHRIRDAVISYQLSVISGQQAGVRVVPVDTAVNILRELDVFVHPGLDDAMPVSIVEALMCGLPCIATAVGGIPDLIRDGVEGYLIPPASTEAILKAMEKFAALTNEEMMAFHQRARVRYMEACRLEVVGAQVAGIYREVAAKSDEIKF